MSRSRRGWWGVYALCVVLLAASLAWLSRVALELEASERRSAASVGRQESLRLALSRMDAWFSPQLAREAMRPYFEYLPFYPSQRAYNRILNPLDPNEVLTRSPLVTHRSELIPLHFQVDAQGTLTSPQAPTGNYRELAVSTCMVIEDIDRNDALLRQYGDVLDADVLRTRLASVEPVLLAALAVEPQAPPAPNAVQTRARGEWQDVYGAQQARGDRARVKRNIIVENTNLSQVAADSWVAERIERGDATVGEVRMATLVPLWLTTDTPGLAFVRRVSVGENELFQGFLVDWSFLESQMLGQVSDLFPDATLRPVSVEQAENDETGRVLATVPAEFVVAEEPPLEPEGFSPARLGLLLMWIAGAGAALAVGLTLRASISFGESRSRFASTVTHELRTPLTTFRMYSEMLAAGMVTDKAKQQEYLETLEHESARLATLVENVLAYSRLEDGRARARSEELTLTELLERVMPPVERRVADCDVELSLDAGDAADLSVDVNAVGQILFNLVDNACKYGVTEESRRVWVDASTTRGRLRVTVRDEGPGIPAGASVFRPFDRGAADAYPDVPGVGLGLALSRGLARELGGDLTLERGGTGARFVLDLPARA